jgi:hypothetical protein
MVGIVVTISPNLSLYKIVVLPAMHSVASAHRKRKKKQKKKTPPKHNAQRDDFLHAATLRFFSLVSFLQSLISRLTGSVEADHENAHVLLAKARKEFAKDISHFRVVEKFQKKSLLCVLCGDATEKKKSRKKKKMRQANGERNVRK